MRETKKHNCHLHPLSLRHIVVLVALVNCCCFCCCRFSSCYLCLRYPFHWLVETARTPGSLDSFCTSLVLHWPENTVHCVHCDSPVDCDKHMNKNDAPSVSVGKGATNTGEERLSAHGRRINEHAYHREEPVFAHERQGH